jgi:hypothetical protein
MSATRLAMGMALLAIGGLQMQAQGPPPQGPAPQSPQMQQPEDEVGMSTAGVPAGGNWLEYQAEDKMSPHPRIRFELDGDNFLRGSNQRPKVIIYCTAGKFKLGDFRPNLRIGPPNRVSTWAWRPQLQVRVRVDNRTDNRNWNWVNGRFLAMDKDTTRLLLAAKIFRIEFNSEDGVQVAEFSPTGLDLKRVQQQCGLKPLKP